MIALSKNRKRLRLTYVTRLLALLGSSIVEIINNKKMDEKFSHIQINLIKKLSETVRLLTDLQRNETLTQRSLILTTISNAQKETLNVTKADEWLFGEKLGD